MNEQSPKPEPTGIQPGVLSAPPATDAPVVYRPISGWAVAGLATGGLFALAVAASTVLAMIQGAPVFFPVWIVIIPILGLALSWFGQWQIQTSEGTRAGIPLARWGFRLSLISGLTYFAYYFVSAFTVQSQANAFMMEKGEDAGFFPLLREGSQNPSGFNAAFLLTIPAPTRSGRPDDEFGMRKRHDSLSGDGNPGQLTRFREGFFGRVFFKHLNDSAEVIPLSVRNWTYELRSYKIFRAYRIKTKEIAELDLVMAVFSNEPESAGQVRKWFVKLDASGPVGKPILTPVGEGVRRLRGSARDWLDEKIRTWNDGAAFPNVKEADRTNWNQLGLTDADRTAGQAAVYRTFLGHEKKRFSSPQVVTRAEDLGAWEQVEGKVRLNLMFRFHIPEVLGHEKPSHTVDAYAIVETRQAIDLERFTDASPRPEWNLIGLDFVNVNPVRPPEIKKLAPLKEKKS
ncbi:MAG: hypothetical protein HYX68_02125 [Planctomycetes bacterium]|nr:hypothetical protein [Planctomycetota bacterium]